MASKYQEKFELVEKRIKETGMNAKDVCREMKLDPHKLYTWRSKQKQSGARVIVHHPEKKRSTAKIKPTADVTGYMVFGTPEFLKQFAGLQ